MSKSTILLIDYQIVIHCKNFANASQALQNCLQNILNLLIIKLQNVLQRVCKTCNI